MQNTQERIERLFVRAIPNDDDRIIDFAKIINRDMKRRKYETALQKFLKGE